MIILEAMNHVRILRIIIEVIEYIVPDDLLEELGIDEMTYDELKALFELFDLDRWVAMKRFLLSLSLPSLLLFIHKTR